MRYYCIRHKKSGAVLPDANGRRGMGGTHVEPVPFGGPWPPRLFHTKAAAQVSLTWWLKGRTSVSRGNAYSDWGDDYYEDWHTEPVPERNPDDWHVAPVEIDFGETDEK